MPLFTADDELTRILAPAVRSLLAPADDLRRVQSAIGQDNKIRVAALPVSLYPLQFDWLDTSTCVTQTLTARRCPGTYQLQEIHAYVTTAPTGSSIVANIETTDNETLATVEIAADEHYGSTVGLGIPINGGVWIRAQITQVGSGTAGSNLTIHAVLYPMER